MLHVKLDKKTQIQLAVKVLFFKHYEHCDVSTETNILWFLYQYISLYPLNLRYQ